LLVDEEAERAAVEVARVAWGFPRTPGGRDDLLRQVREITAGLDSAAVMIALGALLRRGIDQALHEGRDDAGDEEFERFFEAWLEREERRAELS
jgi:hypothetical protein